MQSLLSGRISQKTYLKATLFTWALSANFALSFMLLATSPGFQQSPIFVFFAAAALLVALGLFVFSIQLQIKRWHDLGNGAEWVWVNLVPIVSLYYHFVLLFRKGDPEDNLYGLKPIDEGGEYILQLVTSVIALAIFAPLTWSTLGGKAGLERGVLHPRPQNQAFTMTEISLQSRLQETPCHAQSAYELSQSYLRTNHDQEAIDLAQKYKATCGDHVVQLTWAAFEAAKSLHNTKLAESLVSDLIKRDPRDADYRVWRGMLYETKAEWQKAAEDFEEAIRLKPRLQNIPLNLVDAYRQLKQPCKALTAHSRFLSTYPDLQKDRDFVAFNRNLQAECRTPVDAQNTPPQTKAKATGA